MGVKTDNHYGADKVALRAAMCAHLDKIRVLDAFGGHGVVWAGVRRQTGKPVERVAIDQRLDLDRPHLHGDNAKVLDGLDLSGFDVVDLDAYGIPADLIHAVVREKRFRGVVFVTAIQTMQGGMPDRIARELGLPPTLPRTCQSIIARHGWTYLKGWLASLGVEEITHRSKARKHYLGFRTDGG